MATTSDGLIALLKRKNIVPTGDRAKDLELAKKVMPAGYKKLNAKLDNEGNSDV